MGLSVKVPKKKEFVKETSEPLKFKQLKKPPISKKTVQPQTSLAFDNVQLKKTVYDECQTKSTKPDIEKVLDSLG